METHAPKAVFLSYASQDAEAAQRVAEALRSFGVEVWFDQSELRGGDAWDQKIRRQIKECALFMPVISANTNSRAEGYFRLEWKLAVDRSHLMADDAPFLLPLVIDSTPDATARVPDKFREVQWSRLPGGEMPPAFAERVRGLLAGTMAQGRRMGSESSRTADHENVPGWRPAAGLTVPGTPWIMEAKLGMGGFGEVWLGRHQTMKEPRVFKFCFRADRVRSLKRELTLFRVLKERIGGHPNIVRLLDVHFDEPPYYVGMDYVEGQSLQVWCDQQGGVGKVPLAARLEIVAQMADALHAAHAAGVIHCDVKPGNILIAQTGGGAPTAKLSDFGIGQVVSDEALAGMTKSGFTKSIVAEASSAHSGTQIYMAPELLVGEPTTPRSDIYSLGVVLFQLAVGDLNRPLTTDWPRTVDDAVLREDLARCFAGKPEERFANAGELAKSLRAIAERRAIRLKQQAATAARERVARRWKIVGATTAAALVIGLAASLVMFLQRNAKVRKVRDEMLPEIRRLVAAQEVGRAYELAVIAGRLAPDDAGLRELWEQVSMRKNIKTDPAGAEVWFKEYARPTSEWQRLGLSPLTGVRLPCVYARWKFVKEGHVDLERATQPTAAISVTLDKAGSIPSDMVKVPVINLQAPAAIGLPEMVDHAFFIDRFEVTNRQFKEFVDRGGYTKAEFWKQPFVKAGRTLTREEALAEFRDSTGRPGPATWMNGTYAEGKADFPVTGLSWFEAAAYAEFAGKRLPSIYHWRIAALSFGSASIVPLSNFSGKGTALVGTYQGMSANGAYDMAGNAKEWCWNEARSGSRHILGGGWHEPEYSFVNLDAVSPFSREPSYGFRCMKFLSPPTGGGKFDEPHIRTVRDYTNERPVSDETFEVFRRFYAYDKTPLEVKAEATDYTSPKWRREKVSFNTAYGERMAAIVFLPKNAQPPFQAIVYFPGSTAERRPSSEQLADMERVEALVASGRALIYPIYKCTYERRRQGQHPDFQSAAYRDEVVMQFKDMARSIDYLETRTDIQIEKLAYAGGSWGAVRGAIFPAMEPRIKTSVLMLPGLLESKPLPEVDQINFAPRNKVPTLMIGGRYDYRFLLEESQKPMYNLLGAPPEHKRHELFDTGHSLSNTQIVSVAYPWLDKYLGPVK